ncbi:MAG: AcrB/AcrD/AcrF family protein [Pseudomonadota bacterium]|nr:AcrB/AcrD/AcrF family protein [Pseudomonadota bacterium]
MAGAGSDFYTRHWRLLVALAWVLTSAVLLYNRWGAVSWFALGDTDDNMRIMQVRALLAGQDWYDMRQYRLDPPGGANIHWSRIVDLPLAGMMLLFRPLAGGPLAERIAVAVAPFLPMAIAMAAIAVTSRRLLSPKAFALALALLLCAHSARGMWAPLRIDHHGWQLAMLALAVAALADPRKARGGLTLGLATAVSLTIGLEMLVFLALAGAAVALMWVYDEKQGRRLVSYGASLAGGCALGYLLFASYDNRLAVCDALSPVWLSGMVAAGAVAVLLPLLPLRSHLARLAAGAALAGLIVVGFALAWPHCLGRLEGVSPELQDLWLENVREARPIYSHNLRTIVAVVSLPIAGLVGYAVMLWRLRSDAGALKPWAALGTIALAAAAMLLWQSRAGAAAQLLAVPGATALGWLLISAILGLRLMALRVIGVVGTFVLVSGLAAQNLAQLVPEKQPKRTQLVNRANGTCPTLAALKPVAQQPQGYVLTFLDLNPRLIAVTHHEGVAGPYHRNQAAIIELMKTWRGSAENARRTVARRGIDYVLICPSLSESTIYSAEAPNGFYAQLAKGEVPAWLEPIPLPADSPYKMWRVRR